MKNTYYVLKKGYTLSSSDDVTLIIPTTRENSNRIFELESTAKDITVLLKKKQTIEQLTAKLAKNYPQSEHKKISKYSLSFIKQLVKLKIVAETKK